MVIVHTPETRLEASLPAHTYVRKHLVSGQAIWYGRQYAPANIRLSGVFISQ